MTRLFVLTAALVTLSTCATAEVSHQPYKGLEARDIASLSKDDIRQLQREHKKVGGMHTRC